VPTLSFGAGNMDVNPAARLLPAAGNFGAGACAEDFVIDDVITDDLDLTPTDLFLCHGDGDPTELLIVVEQHLDDHGEWNSEEHAERSPEPAPEDD
jgi:hypothetical protein